jgi:uncharacterized protein YfcZ (UPF0381/DUF406 family)
MTIAELEAKAADMKSGIAAASQCLREALLSGASTAEIRKFLAQLQDELRQVEAELGVVRAEQEQAEVRKAEDAARDLEADFARRLKARLAALEIPPIPTHSWPSKLPA